eukprot:TRINITY_DN29282_c0_g1_i1.p1 TRINITY_DN29282_c0_g1~~TRINITY_DN29282_c0_g1_i1.p1  ORF type:complete len:113 (+),score=27.91 TRINITY_DN29282_c0_g1_i1:142-480(+)
MPRWVCLANVEECAKKYGQQAEDLRKAVRAASALIEEEDTPASAVALRMRREVLEEIYTDVMKKHQALQAVVARHRLAAKTKICVRHLVNEVKVEVADSVPDLGESPCERAA